MSERKPTPKAAIAIAGVALFALVALIASQVRALVAASDVPVIAGAPRPEATAISSVAPPTAAYAAAYSNIYKYDYVGPEACGNCHPKNYALWRNHPHSRMNQNATAATVVGDFSDARIDYGDGDALFARDGGEYIMTIERRGKPVRRFKVTRTVGSRFVQMYIGVQTEGPEPQGDEVYTAEVKLPFSYWIDRKEWFPQTYDENPGTAERDAKGELTSYYSYHGKATDSWKRVCVKCHDTYAFSLRFDAAPDGKLLGFSPADVVFKKAKPKNEHAPLPEIEPWDLVTLGISCESCHLGGKEHALHGEPISFLPKSPDVEVKHASVNATKTGKSAYAVNALCNQCHAADPQGPLYPDGSASWNARESADLMGGACKGEIACTDCHNPHQAGPTAVKRVDERAFAEACTRCHTEYKKPEVALAHGGHTKDAAVGCLDCHMPRTVHGLSSMTRSHHISSPTDARMFDGEYPNACNLCHLDKTTRWTLDALSTKWKKHVEVKPEIVASEVALGKRWLNHPVPVVRQVAAAAYARSPLGKDNLDSILSLLQEEDPPTRMFGVLSVESILGRSIGVAEYTPWATAQARAHQIATLAASAAR